jgi:hypothetical protein
MALSIKCHNAECWNYLNVMLSVIMLNGIVLNVVALQKLPTFSLVPSSIIKNSRAACIRHQCRKTPVLSFHSCLINTCVEKLTTFKKRLEL